MKQNRKLIELKNIGKKIAARLNEIGIFSEDELHIIGVVEAHSMIKKKYPNETIPVCYYLYSFEGALCNKHWNDIGEEKKRELKAKISYKANTHGRLKALRKKRATLLTAGDLRR